MTLCTSSSNLSIRRKISNGSIVCATHVMPLATFDIPADSWPGKDISASPGNNRLPRPRGLVPSPTATSSKNTAQILKKWFSLLPGSFSCWLRWTGQFFQFLWNWPTCQSFGIFFVDFSDHLSRIRTTKGESGLVFHVNQKSLVKFGHFTLFRNNV